MLFKELLWISIILSVRADILDIMRPKTVRIHKLTGTCPGYENATITFNNLHLSLSNKLHMISLRVVAKKNVQDGLKLKLILKRCPSREALDSCEKYQTIKIKHLCDLLNAENMPWTPFVTMSTPPMACPIRKGSYVINNGTFDGSAFSHLPVAGWYWIVTSYVLEEKTDRVVLCSILEGQVVPV